MKTRWKKKRMMKFDVDEEPKEDKMKEEIKWHEGKRI